MGHGRQAAGAAEDVQPEGKGPEQGRQETRRRADVQGPRRPASADARVSTGSAAAEAGGRRLLCTSCEQRGTQGAAFTIALTSRGVNLARCVNIRTLKSVERQGKQPGTRRRRGTDRVCVAGARHELAPATCATGAVSAVRVAGFLLGRHPARTPSAAPEEGGPGLAQPPARPRPGGQGVFGAGCVGARW